jgi:predicted membrane-bound mannosyltransferase
MLTVFGAGAVTFMMLMYALERRHPGYLLAFAFGCALSSAYGFLAGTWPFGVVEAIWALIAVRRWRGVGVSSAERSRRAGWGGSSSSGSPRSDRGWSR